MAVVAALAAIAAAVVALAGNALWGPQPLPPPSPFGGLRAVHIAKVGHIEVDLEPAQANTLRRIVCDGAPVGTTCFVAAAER
jgi:hypothetical protein